MIKILAIDDEPGMCQIIKETFAPMGFDVYMAYDGDAGITSVKADKPNLVFLDVRMMGKSGLEVLREIKEYDKAIRVVMLTVLSDEETKTKARELGADDFITKPFMSEHLEGVAKQEIAALLAEHKIKKPNILVVDDEEEVRIHLASLISRHFFSNVDNASDGEKALIKLQDKNYDLVLIDIKMPGLNGLDVIREALKFTPATQFLAISGYDSEDIADEVLKAGAVDFLHKPQTVEGIDRKVKEILRKIGKYVPKWLRLTEEN